MFICCFDSIDPEANPYGILQQCSESQGCFGIALRASVGGLPFISSRILQRSSISPKNEGLKPQKKHGHLQFEFHLQFQVSWDSRANEELHKKASTSPGVLLRLKTPVGRSIGIILNTQLPQEMSFFWNKNSIQLDHKKKEISMELQI